MLRTIYKACQSMTGRLFLFTILPAAALRPENGVYCTKINEGIHCRQPACTSSGAPAAITAFPPRYAVFQIVPANAILSAGF